MQNAAHENPQNSKRTGWYIASALWVSGLGIGVMLHFAENSAMGSRCQTTLLLDFTVESIMLQFFPIYAVVLVIYRPNPRTNETVKNLVKVSITLLFVWLQLVIFQAVPNLGIMFAAPKQCLTDSGTESLGSDWLYIILWICTGLRTILLIMVLAADVSMTLYWYKYPAEFNRMFFPGLPWFDRKKRARVLRQLVRCAGTKEGCRLLAQEYRAQMFTWQNCADHQIAINCIERVCWSLAGKSDSQKVCAICEETLVIRETLFTFSPQPSLDLMAHMRCVTSLERTALQRFVQNPMGLIESLADRYPAEAAPRRRKSPDPVTA